VQPTCPACDGLLLRADVLTEPEQGAASSSDDDDDADDENEGGNRPRKRKRRRGNPKNKTEREIGDDERWVQPVLRDRSKWIEKYKKAGGGKDLVASAKTVAVKNQILIWQREAPGDKIIGEPSLFALGVVLAI
jgi:hypothetical protein